MDAVIATALRRRTAGRENKNRAIGTVATQRRSSDRASCCVSLRWTLMSSSVGMIRSFGGAASIGPGPMMDSIGSK